MSSIYGSIKLGTEPEQAAIDILKKWLPVYMAEVSLQIGWNGPDIPAPRSYTTRTRIDHLPEDQLPQVIVVSPGLAEKPKKEGDGSYRAKWSIGISVIVSAKDEPSTKALGKFYAGAVRAILLQHQTLGGHSIGVDWMDESYDDIPDGDDDTRNLGAGTGYFVIEMDQVVSVPGGPRTIEPPIPSTQDWPGENRWPDPETIPPDPQAKIVESATVTLKREAL